MENIYFDRLSSNSVNIRALGRYFIGLGHFEVNSISEENRFAKLVQLD